MPQPEPTDDTIHHSLEAIDATLTTGFETLTSQWQSATRQQQNQFDALADAISTLSEQIEVLRNALDDLRDQLQWGQQNGRSQNSSAEVASPPSFVEPTTPPQPNEGHSAKTVVAKPPHAHGRLF